MEKKSIRDLDRDSVEVFRAKDKVPVVIVLDNIRSLNNIGSIFRTADAFAIKHIALCGITATPPSVEIHKTALGAEDSIEWSHHESTSECLQELISKGYTVCALEQVKESIPLQQFKVDTNKSYAIVVGHEVQGVSQEAIDAAHYCIEIPQFGTKHSLNVAVSTAIALWHFIFPRI